MFTKCVAVSRMGAVVIKHGVKVSGQCCWDILLSQHMLDAVNASLITILFLHKTVHLVFNTVQLLQCKTLNFLSPDLWPCNSPELNSADYKIYGVTQQHEHELLITRLNKLSQQLVEV